MGRETHPAPAGRSGPSRAARPVCNCGRKTSPIRPFWRRRGRFPPLCKQYRVAFILNDNVALAAQCGADGVHLGQEDMDPAEARRILGPDAIIGVSAHNVAEAKAAVAAGADYLGCGAMFATTTKKRTSPPCPRRRCGPSAPPSPCRSSPSAASANRTCSPSPTAAKRALHWSAPSSRRRILKRSAGN